MTNILVTGAKGQLGSEIKELSTLFKLYTLYHTDYNNLDITKHSVVDEFIESNNISVIINCAAYTAVDKAEENLKSSSELNSFAVKNLAKIAKSKNLKLIHISTDYVFNGNNYVPYLESDKTDPQSIYGITKLQGENFIKDISPNNSIIIRTSWVYSSYGNNFVKTMLGLSESKDELGVIVDQIGTPTYAKDLALVILQIIPKISNNTPEIYHYSNEGVCSWFDFSKAIFEIKNIDIRVNALDTSQYPTPAKRPYFSVLNKTKIKNKFQIEVPYWKDSLKECLNKL